MQIQLQFTGRGYPAAHRLPEEIDLEPGADLATALRRISAHLGDETLSNSCLIAVSGKHVGTLGNYINQTLRDGDEIIVLAPVAGG
jgi:molybdopterin converting factor small subunit